MQPRLEHVKVSPGAYRAMMGLETYVRQCGLEESLLHMIKLRASQINGCAFCIDMHWKDARAAGESEERLYSLDAWRESPLYDERERAALEYADAMTVTGRDVTDELFARLRQFYDDDALVELTMIIAWENSSSKFNRALRVPSQKLWKP